jgi:flagellar biosynthesis protein FliQ
MIEVLELVREGLALVVVAAIPLLFAALLGGVLAGVAVALLGLQDQTVAAVFRAAGVVIALLLVVDDLGEQLQTFTADAWATLPALGRGGAR